MAMSCCGAELGEGASSADTLTGQLMGWLIRPAWPSSSSPVETSDFRGCCSGGSGMEELVASATTMRFEPVCLSDMCTEWYNAGSCEEVCAAPQAGRHALLVLQYQAGQCLMRLTEAAC